MNIDELKSHALAARREIVTMIYESGIGHPGGALSIIDVLTRKSIWPPPPARAW